MKGLRAAIRNFIKDEDGATTIELILCMPLLMLICSYIICFSQLFYAKQMALTAADIGARVAITKTQSSVARTSATEAAKEYLSAAGMGIAFKEDDLSYTTWKRGNLCDYTVTVTVQTAMPMPRAGGFDKMQEVTAKGHMMIEREN